MPELLKNEPSCQIFGVDWSAIENFQYFEAAATSQEVLLVSALSVVITDVSSGGETCGKLRQ